MTWERLAGTIIRELRARHDLSQRALAQLTGIPQPTISEIEAGKRQPTLPLLGRLVEGAGGGVEILVVPSAGPTSARATAAEIRRRLEAVPPDSPAPRSEREDGALRAALDLRDQLAELGAEQVARATAARPDSTGNERWDAFLAAVVEEAAAAHDIAPPRWVEEPRWFVRPYWYASDSPRFHAWELANTPGAFWRHGILVAEQELASA